LEREACIRAAHREGMSVRAIGSALDLSPARIGQILAQPEPGPLLDQLRALRVQWGVDEHPGTRAAADGIIADLATDELTRPRTCTSRLTPKPPAESDEPRLF
jgi:hypothetical protein